VERGQDFPDAGLRGRDRGRRRNHWAAAFRMRGSGRLRREFPRSCGRGRTAWIVGQVEEHFGAQGSYLIGFYHVCEYLSDAAKSIAPEPAVQKTWMEAQEDALKTGRLDKTLQALARHFEAAEVDDDQAPVRRCHRSSKSTELS
jgi:hypothetical protein